MPIFNFQIKTSSIEASGSIEAKDEAEAQELLQEQYLPKDHGFADEKGKKLAQKILKIDLAQVN
jgi:hypothetical protein